MSADITFVDKDDKVIGSGSKEQAWKNGDIHRIVRIFVFNPDNEFLIHRRSMDLKSSPGKWDQSAAGHVDVGEEYLEAAKRELEEEVGIEGVELREVGKFYQEEMDESDKVKKRFNMLYEAKYDGEVDFDDREVSEVKWIEVDKLSNWMQESPGDFTQGFIISLEFYQSRKTAESSAA